MSSPEDIAEPALMVYLDQESMEARRDNATLFTFLGELSVFDHVYLEFAEDSGNKGIYVFNEVHPEAYEGISNYMMEHDYPAVLNMQTVPECDNAAFYRDMLSDMHESASVPDAWLSA